MTERERPLRKGARGQAPLGIICGGGRFPAAVADAAIAAGRRVHLFLLRGFADTALERYPHDWIDIGRFGATLRALQRIGCREVVMIGTLVRPQLSQLRLDLAAFRLLPRMAKLYLGGDDRLLSGIAKIFEEHGFRLRGAHEVAPGLLMPAGVIGRQRPNADARRDLRRGFELLRAIGAFDVGQAAVVAERRIIAVEAAEGTAALLARVAELRRNGRLRLPRRTGVLVKAPKPGQDRRLDLPAIGADTVAQANEAQLAGIAVEAGGTLVADPVALKQAADATGLFVMGVPARRTRR